MAGSRSRKGAVRLYRPRADARGGVPGRGRDVAVAREGLAGGPGMTLQDVTEQLGHSTIVLTNDTYGHSLDGRRSEMARELDAVLGG